MLDRENIVIWIIRIVAVILLIAIPYLVLSLVFWDISIANWGVIGRILFLVSLSTLFYLALKLKSNE